LSLITDHSSLLPTIRQVYNLSLENLQFLLRGWGGACYSAEAPDGTRYFLKFHDKAESLALAASSRAFYLPLTYQLHHKKILPHIPHPIPTRDGRLWLQVDPYALVITNFIEGDLIGFGALPNKTLSTLAFQVGILHTCLPSLEFDQPFQEGFQISFESILSQFLTCVPILDIVETPSIEAMRSALLPRRAEIQGALNHLKRLQAYAQSSQPSMVVCHTDIHGGNLMTGCNEKLYLLDWENAMIAPPEHDLMFFAGEPGFFETFLPIYARQAGSSRIDLKLLEFYFFHRALEDLADFVLRIRSGTSTPEQDHADLQECIDILDSMLQIQKTLEDIRDELR